MIRFEKKKNYDLILDEKNNQKTNLNGTIAFLSIRIWKGRKIGVELSILIRSVMFYSSRCSFDRSSLCQRLEMCFSFQKTV